MKFISFGLGALFFCGCADPQSLTPSPTHELVAHTQAQDIGYSGGQRYASCSASYSNSSDPTNTPIVLESNAVVTCNSQAMQVSGTSYYGTVAYPADGPVLITVVRPDDGSSLLTTTPVQ